MTDSVHAAAMLLERVPAIIKKFEEQYRKTGRTYNIFKIARIDEKEVNACLVMADLLNPKGLHKQGTAYLKLFMDMVLRPLTEKAGHLSLLKTKVITEYSITENRRIDIVLDDGTIFIPIEVKINAKEQENQLGDYADFSRRMNVLSGFIPVLFLTPHGVESKEASKDDYIPISFKKHIISWLTECLKLEETQKISPIRENIKQFIRAIKSFCGYMEDEDMSNAINALISESKDSYAAALAVKRAVDELDFDVNAWEIFKDQIFKLVNNKLPDTKYLEIDDEEWHYFAIPIGKNCTLSINYDMQKVSVDLDDSEKSISAEIADKIRKTMTSIFGVHNEDWGEGNIWVSTGIKYPGLEDTDDDDMYKYELHRIYSKEQQSVADRIVSIVMELLKI